jgi:vancomycin resistance protein YoaR
MKKKTILLLTLLALPIMLVLLGGYTYFKSFFTLRIEHEGSIVFEKRYQIPFGVIVATAVRHNGDYAKYYRARTDLTYSQKLNYLSHRLGRDLIELNRYNSAPKDAAYLWDSENTEFTYQKEAWGQEVDMSALAEAVFENLSAVTKIRLPCKPLPPAKKYQDIRKATALRGFYSTDYSSSAFARKHNIALAAQRLNGTVIAPGEILSFNKVVGARTAANGFLQSIIISEGHFVPGTGGGVCQVSTTLYNACLRAGLTINYARPHSLPVSYVPPSCDAMVSNVNDLIIKNETDSAFFIKTQADGAVLSVYVYGDDTTNGSVFKIKSVVERRIECNEYEEVVDHTLLPGERKVIKTPKAGLVSSAYIEYYKNGVPVGSKKIRQDYYRAQKGVISVSPHTKSDLHDGEIEIPDIDS